MNFEEIKTWKSGVNALLTELDDLVATRNDFRNVLKNHLDQVFGGYESMEFKNDLTEVTIKYAYENNPVIKPENINKLGMDWIIEAGYDKEAYRIVVIKIYPFGLSEGDYIK